MKYKATSYLCTNFCGVMDTIETDDFFEVQDFIFEQCQKGYQCVFKDNETGDEFVQYPDNYTE